MDKNLNPNVTLDELEGMSMEDFADQPEAGRSNDFTITDDNTADWAVRKIQEERAELARMQQMAEEQIECIKEKLEAAEKRCESSTGFLTAKLAQYFETVPHKKTKTQLSYRLLSGTLKKKIGGQTLKQNDEKLLEYLKLSDNTDMIRLKEEPMWGEFKKRLEITGGVVVDKETGEIVEGVDIITKPDTFVVEV